MYQLRLYVTGTTPTSQAAIDKLRSHLQEAYGDQYRLDILNIFEHPKRAERDEILITPTIIRVLPPPIRKLVGDLSDTERVLAGLELVPEP